MLPTQNFMLSKTKQNERVIKIFIKKQKLQTCPARNAKGSSLWCDEKILNNNLRTKELQ